MNKNHRVIWSVIRNCFVVASEVAKAKGKPSSTRKTVAAAIAALFIAPVAAAGAPICGNETNISGAVGAQCYEDQAVIINNSGSISANNAYAVNVDAYPYTQTFTNNGSISGTASQTGYPNVAAVYFDGDVSGSIVNNGSITIVNENTSGQAYSAAILMSNLVGNLTNRGSITASSTASIYSSSGDAYAAAIAMNSMQGSLTNSGTISATATATAYSSANANAYGVMVNNDLNGSLTNSGTISATATADYSEANAFGVFVGGNLNEGGALTNSGNIKATALSYSDTAMASGVNVVGSLDGSLTNSGKILATATGYYSATAYGVYLGEDLNGTLTNSGTISATAIANTDSAYAYGLYVGNNLNGTVTNSGTITAKANVYSSSYANAYGVYVDGDLAGSLVNASTGTISAEAKNTHSYSPYAYGVNVSGNLSGSLTNAGTISATATGNTDSAYAYGVSVDGDLSGSLTNTGTISAKATVTDSDSAYAYGVYANTISGTLTNKGTITATASNVGGQSATGDAYAYGIYTYGVETTGSIINEGTIKATANRTNNGTDYIYASAAGIYVDGTLNGAITNKGTISAAVNDASSGDAYGSAYGIYVNSDVGATGAINNSGAIAATAYAYGTSQPEAYGIYVGGNVAGSITNSGSITAKAVGETSAYAYGVVVRGNLASLTNTGSITATATAKTNDYASAYGVLVNGTLTNLTNSGTISATASGGLNSYASAYGISVNTLTGQLINSGNITATALGGSTGEDNYAYGVYVNNLNGGTITNSGTISAFAEASAPGEDNAYSISTFGVGTINNLAGGVLDGQVFAGGAISLNNDGLLNTRLGESHVGEDYNQGTTGVFKLSAVDDATYGSLYARGTATLAEGTTIRVAVDPAHTLAADSVLQNVIYGAAGLSMGGVNVQDNNLSLNFTAADNTFNGVDLTATSTGLTTVVAAVTGAGLGSAAGAGGVLDTLLANPDAQSPQVANFLYGLGGASSAQEVTNKVAELLPLMSGSVNHATLDTMRMLNLAINQRLDAKAGVASGDLAFSDKHFWLKPFGSWANQDKRNGTAGYDADTYGLAFGADGQISDANTVGLAISYARTDLDSDMTRQNADVDSYQAAFYGTHKFSDATSLNYQADFGYHDNSGRRSITGVGSAKSDYDSWSGHVGASLAHTIAIDEATTFTPSIRADYSRIRAESYREKGAGGFNLNVGSETTDELILGADGKLARSISEKATAFANLGVGYDVINERTSMTSAFAGVPGAVFTTRGIDPSPWLLRGGLGIVGQATETLELSLRYDFEVRNDFDNQTASVRARWAF